MNVSRGTMNALISDLKPAAYNPRKIEPKELNKLVKSIKTFGFVEPVVINKDNTIIGGHQRLKAAQKMGMTEVPVVQVDIPKGQEKALNLALNRISGEWDETKLAEVLVQLTKEEREQSGFDEDEIAKAIGAAINGEEDDFDTTPPVEPKTKLGDLYELGEHRLLCGDSCDLEQVKQLMRGEQADMAWTDPPYNVNYEGGNGLKIENDSMDDLKFRRFLTDAFKNMAWVLGEGCPFYIAHASSESYNFVGAVKDAGLLFKQTIVWVKDRLVLGRQDYQWRHEPILYGWKPGSAHKWYGEFDKTTVLDQSRKFEDWSKEELIDLAKGIETDILRIEKPSKSKEHPTMKPIALIASALQNSSQLGGVVLDLFGGSGSTLIACEQLGRKCRIMELSPAYCDVIVNRWEKLTGKKAVLV